MPQPESEIRKVARTQLGFETLREGQEEAVTSLLQGRDTVVVQPTGSGKSAIYMIAGLMLPGPTVIVSPLIALQKDQIDAIEERDLAPAAVLNSAQPAKAANATVADLEAGELEYLFLAPEQLKKPEILDKLKSAGVSLFVIDEAHCISEWGHDFRPDYLNLGRVIEELGHPVVLAMTATAQQEVRQEIIQRLGLNDPKLLIGELDRPNINLRVDHFETEEDKTDGLVHRVTWAEKPGIVYTSTRKKAEEIMGALAEENVSAIFYHAGLGPKERERIHQEFMEDKVDVLVATSAFGMGVDKPNIRFVYHYDISDSLDSYYQEIGRAGRDGEPAEATLFYRHQNLGIKKFQGATGKVNQDQIEQVAEAVAEEEAPASVEEIAERTGLSQTKVVNAVHRLEDVGAVESLASGEVQPATDVDPEHIARAADEEARRQERKKQRLEHMQEYAELGTCRRQYLLGYFGERLEQPCGNCDICFEKMPKPASPSLEGGTRREVTA